MDDCLGMSRTVKFSMYYLGNVVLCMGSSVSYILRVRDSELERYVVILKLDLYLFRLVYLTSITRAFVVIVMEHNRNSGEKKKISECI